MFDPFVMVKSPYFNKSECMIIIHQPETNIIYLYAKDLYEAKYQLLIKKQQSTAFRHFNDPKAIIEYSDAMDDIYKKIREYSPNKKNENINCI